MHKTSINGLYRLFVAFKLPYFVKRTYNAPVKVVFCQFEKFGFLQILVQNSCSKPILVIKSLYLGVGGMSNFFGTSPDFARAYFKWNHIYHGSQNWKNMLRIVLLRTLLMDAYFSAFRYQYKEWLLKDGEGACPPQYPSNSKCHNNLMD